MPRWPDKTVSSSESYAPKDVEQERVEKRDSFPVKISSSEEAPKRRVRVPGTIFEVDEQGVVHVPEQLRSILFDKNRKS